MGIGTIVGGTAVLWTLLYTINFGRWAWGAGGKRAAIGIWLLAVAVAAVPLWVAIRR